MMGQKAVENKFSCVLSLVLVCGLLALLVAAIAWPWLSKNAEYSKQAQSSSERIARYQRLLKQRPMLEAELKKSSAEQNKQGYFLNSTDPELAAAQMQARVKEVVQASGGTLVSTQNIPARSDIGAGKIEIKVRMKGDANVLTGVLHDLESAHPLMFVEDLSIRSRRTVKGRRKNRVTTYSLDVNFNLMGYMQGGS